MGDEYRMEYTDVVLLSCTPENYIKLLTNVTPLKLIKIKKNFLITKMLTSESFEMAFFSFLQ